eukprot:CAMPEP_0170498198 /NCGR_PEP_ID=MMETSP0208-20121228/27136_1 /TAXON_ID=197538 /ORGANISM="Strombidium inclinatum, Strain S3" /LENGTH=114 /DNA_ID=CAMNT_0010775305 /DNA_START=285 /DNA_END=629 /DNA_ORIENTATION=+
MGLKELFRTTSASTFSCLSHFRAKSWPAWVETNIVHPSSHLAQSTGWAFVDSLLPTSFSSAPMSTLTTWLNTSFWLMVGFFTSPLLSSAAPLSGKNFQMAREPSRAADKNTPYS